MSTPDQGRMLADLARTVAQAGYDTLVETWKLRRLLAAAELAEAVLAADDAEVPDWRVTNEAFRAASLAYRAARVAR